MVATDHQTLLLCRMGQWMYGLPIDQVRETMRPLPIEPLAGAPPYVRGLAVIRGAPTPVLDAAILLGGEPAGISRFVTLGGASRVVALAVESVVGIRAIAQATFQEMPPLLRDVGGAAISAIGTLDAELLLLLRAGRLVPAGLWAALEQAEQARQVERTP